MALEKLPQLVERDGRWTPVLVKFLGTTLLRKVRGLARSFARGQRPRREASVAPASSSLGGLDRVAGTETSVPARAEARERQQLLHRCLEELGPRDREVVVLRGIEQMSNRRVAEKLGEEPASVSMRYGRALRKLRRALPDSVFAELPDEAD